MNGSTFRRVYAAYDENGVFVYQAFRPEIVAAAVGKGTFGAGFTRDRLTWIKPSFGWMLHRSGYASKHRQEAIARIHLSHEGFLAILAQAVPTYHVPELFPDARDWAAALARSDARVQWDPDRDLLGRPLGRRAIQIGIRGEAVRRYVDEWVLGVEDVTPLARAVGEAARSRARRLPLAPEEKDYPLPVPVEQAIDATGTPRTGED